MTSPIEIKTAAAPSAAGRLAPQGPNGGVDCLLLTVFFEDPFWVGVFERTEQGGLSACRVVFGAEPKEQQVYELLLKKFCHLQFSPALPSAHPQKSIQNPKSRQRAALRQLKPTGIGTKSQQALSLQREQQNTLRQAKRREKREAEKLRRFEIKQQKKKEKHRGR